MAQTVESLTIALSKLRLDDQEAYDKKSKELGQAITKAAAERKARNQARAERGYPKLPTIHRVPLPHAGVPNPVSNRRIGALAEARYDYLQACEHHPIGVNRQHCRPFHPHAARLAKDGLVTVSRSGRKTSRHTAISITDKGREELARLRQRLGIGA